MARVNLVETTKWKEASSGWRERSAGIAGDRTEKACARDILPPEEERIRSTAAGMVVAGEAARWVVRRGCKANRILDSG